MPSAPIAVRLAAVCLAAVPAVRGGTVIDVAAGDDLPAAVVKARSMAKPVTLRLGGGRHQLAAPLVLTKEDAGLVMEAAPGAVPVLTGSAALKGWTLTDPARRLWQCAVAEARSPGAGKAPAWEPRQLFLDGRRLTRARHPDTGWLVTPGGFTLLDGRTRLPLPADGVRSDWLTGGGELVFTAKWVTLRSRPVSILDGNAGVEIAAANPRPYLSEKEHWFAWENTAQAMDKPGEWRLDTDTGSIQLLAPEGFDPDKQAVHAPRLDHVLAVDGADGVVLRGLTFCETDYTWPWSGRYDAQAACDLRGLVRVRNARGGTVDACTFTNGGGYGLDLGSGSTAWTVRRCAVEEMGAGGVRIGEMATDGPRCGGHTVEDCRVLRYGRLHPAGVGMIIFQSDGNRLLHNEIAHGFYSGFSVGWTWGYRESPCHHNEIAWNRVHDIGFGVLSDMGGIYTLGPQEGTVIHHNFFHDITCRHYGGWGLYTDEGSTGIVLENNVVLRCSSAGFHQHYGRDNLVRNNLLVSCRDHALMRTREEEHNSFTFERNVIIAESGDLLGSNWRNGRFVMRRNLWWDRRLGADAAAYRFAGRTWAEWQAAGHDAESRIADPRLADPDKPEKGLAPDSPAIALGWQPLDLSAAGPRAR